ncbi:MAG: KilA-N, DNA-binding domain protein [Parcubacteria group bacterium GW2011_GWD2_38_11]|nr:MAG: KilA-N, DNA-binding domain protein [Parcubacteria group bacterium GW2011_GWD2_38_11]
MKNIKEAKSLVPQEIIEQKIFLIRERKVMFDRDLAILYGVETRVLNQAVRRNTERFPEDFMFQLNKKEFENWVSQIVITNPGAKKSMRIAPLVFTEQGVAMLSSVLKSEKAIQVNIQIIRTFTKIKEMIISNKELRIKIEELEGKYDAKFSTIFKVITKLITDPERENKRKIGFNVEK